MSDNEAQPPADAYHLAVQAAAVAAQHPRCRSGTPLDLAWCGDDGRHVVWTTDRPNCMIHEMFRLGARLLGVAESRAIDTPDDLKEMTDAD